MKTSRLTRLSALLASVVFTVVIVESIALIGHPPEGTSAELANAKPVLVATAAR